MYKSNHDINSEKKEVQTSEETKNLIDISRLIDDIWKGFKRCWIYLLVLVSICSSLFYVYAKKTYVPEYTASTTFIVNTNQAFNYSGDYYNKATAEQLAKTFPYIISNNALRHIIAENLGVTEIPGVITAEAMEGTNMVTIRVTSSNAKIAYDILQAVIENYPKVANVVIGETQLNIMDETGIPIAPSNAINYKEMAKYGFMVGVVLSVLILLFYALTRKTIRKEEDIKKFLSIKCFGTIPKARFKRTRNAEQNNVLIDNKRIPYGFVEANRTIRTRIEKEMRENDSHIFMLTSAMAGEGKTTVAVNVALSLAKKGKHVILVDADLRHPSVREVMGLDVSNVGFVDVLNEVLSIDKALVRYKETSLKIISGGRPVQNPGKLLSAPILKKVFTDLKEMADYVIVDTPPSGIVFDAAVIARNVDTGIFVVRQDHATLDKITEGIEMLDDTNLLLAGCVLNCAEVGITGYGYGKGYGYGGYGRYGYGGYKKYGKYGYYQYGYGNINREEGNEQEQ